MSGRRIYKLGGLLALTVALAFGALANVACERKGVRAASEGLPEEVKIGVYMPMTGDTATFGISSTNGFNLALKKLNAGGGINGSRVRLIVEDDRGQPEEAKTVVTRLISKERVVAVLGEVQ